MRVAALADLHGNLPALEAVLAELPGEDVDALVVLGDVVGGPLPAEVLAALRALELPLHLVRGNADREAVAAWDGAPAADDEAGRAATHSAARLGRAGRDLLAELPTSLVLDGVRYCHGSPRSDTEIVTRLSPPARIAAARAGAAEPLVVGGHTHQAFVRAADGWANPGAVGMPYEGRPGAFWAVVEGGTIDLRETAYDLEAAAARLRAGGFPDVEGFLAESLLEPVDPEWVAAFFEGRPAG